MNDSLKDILHKTKKSIFLKFDEQDDDRSAMLSHADDKFEVTWHGDSSTGRAVATYKEGYLSFYTQKFVENIGIQQPVSTTIYPKVIMSARRRDLVEADKYDELRITYKNIFTDFNFDQKSYKPIDILKEAGKEHISLKDNVELRVWIGSHFKNSYYPVSKTEYLDDLFFTFTKDGYFDPADVNQYLNIVTKVIALFLGKPIDPSRIELGLRSEDGISDYALVEYGKTYEYSNLDRSSSFYPIKISRASSFIDALRGAFNADIDRVLGIWFSYTEAEYKKYYLDTIMSILLNCAESAFYLLPPYDASKREAEYDSFLGLLEKIEIKPDKLHRFIVNGKSAYVDPVTYETKILKLIKFINLEVPNKEILAKYSNQLRNSLMHGTEPNFDYLVDKNKKPIQQINIGEVLTQLRLIVSSSIIKYLHEHKD